MRLPWDGATPYRPFRGGKLVENEFTMYDLRYLFLPTTSAITSQKRA